MNQLKTQTKTMNKLTPKPETTNTPAGYKTLLEHLEELRTRLTWSAGALVAGGIAGYFMHQTIFRLLTQPLNKPLFYSSPAGGLDFLIKICVFFGILCAIPVLVYHLLKFLEPALPMHARTGMLKILLSSVGLALAGVCFAYFVSLPAALHFLGSLGNGDLTALISANEYLNFVTIYLAGFAALFQLPLIMLFINRIRPLKPGGLMKFQRYVIVGSFIVSAVLTPTPDPFNQSLMAVPIIVLYQISVGLIWLKNRKHPIADTVLGPLMNTDEQRLRELAYEIPEELSLAASSSALPGQKLYIDGFIAPRRPLSGQKAFNPSHGV